MARQLRSSNEHVIEHLLGEAPGEGVLLARMERADHRSIPHGCLHPVAELGTGTQVEHARGDLVAELPQRYEDTGPRQQCQLAIEEGTAEIALVDGRLVRGRRTSNRRSHIGVGQLQTIIERHCLRLIGEARAEERAIEKVAGAIAGEHPTRSVRPMGSRSEADDHHRSRGVAEARHRPAPVHVISVCGSFVDSHLLAPFDQARALSALHDLSFELRQ